MLYYSIVCPAQCMFAIFSVLNFKYYFFQLSINLKFPLGSLLGYGYRSHREEAATLIPQMLDHWLLRCLNLDVSHERTYGSPPHLFKVRNRVYLLEALVAILNNNVTAVRLLP